MEPGNLIQLLRAIQIAANDVPLTLSGVAILGCVYVFMMRQLDHDPKLLIAQFAILTIGSGVGVMAVLMEMDIPIPTPTAASRTAQTGLWSPLQDAAVAARIADLRRERKDS